jgi:hypothetical protein
MRVALTVLLVILFSQQPVTRDAAILVPNGFMTGQAYLDLDARDRTFYTRGFINGMSVAPLLGAPHGDWFSKCIVDRTDVQLAEIIRRFIDAHAERWHEGLNILGYAALIDSCKP